MAKVGEPIALRFAHAPNAQAERPAQPVRSSLLLSGLVARDSLPSHHKVHANNYRRRRRTLTASVPGKVKMRYPFL